MILIDLTGKTFGRLTVLHRDITKKGKHIYWFCICQCGTKKSIAGKSLRCGTSRSCGCLNKEKCRASLTKHGLSNTSEHNIWMDIQRRCYKKYRHNFFRYGGRGIEVCDRWRGKNGFANFISDVGMRPSPKHSLDRIDNDGHYCPENVRWATQKEQSNNRKSNVLLTFRGQTLNMSQWAKETGLTYAAIQLRRKRGWSVEKILTTPLKITSATNSKFLQTK